MDNTQDDFDNVPDGELVKWDKEGMVLAGILKSYKEQPTGKGIGHMYEVRVKGGIAAFFAPSILQKKLSDVKTGSFVKITFVNITKTHSGNTLKNFEVGTLKAADSRFAAMTVKYGVADIGEDGEGDNEFDDIVTQG